jgi:hypothetical protein
MARTAEAQLVPIEYMRRPNEIELCITHRKTLYTGYYTHITPTSQEYNPIRTCVQGLNYQRGYKNA